MIRIRPLCLLVPILAGLLALPLRSQAEETLKRDLDAVVARVGGDIEYLASDELGGRGVGTPGIEAAANRIRDEFERLGLSPAFEDGSYLQAFEVSGMGQAVAEATHLRLTAPDGSEQALKLGDQFQPQLIGGLGPVSGELVFAGYGIMAEDLQYNEYEDLDVKDKILVVIRREPQQADEDSVFDGTGNSRYALIRTKLQYAQAQGAKAVILVNDPHSCPDEASDQLAPPDLFGSQTNLIPFVHVKQSVANAIFATTPIRTPDGQELTTLKEICARIDDTLQPLSQPLTGWKAEYQTDVETVMAHNVIGILEGQGDLADETVIIGAHYDHLGNGGFGSRTPARREIHNGADDNATGTAAVLELARRFATVGDAPRRRLVFIAFSAEERGLIGSQYYVDHPAVPLESTVAMINFDMIGWLREDRLELHGAGSSPDFDALIQVAGSGTDLDLKPITASFGGSDHLPFIGKKIPALFIHTGLTSTYHTPDDDYETINVEGCARVIDFSERLVQELAATDSTPQFAENDRGSRRRMRPRVLLGAQFNLTEDADGLYVAEVTADSPAEAAGMKTADVIVAIDGEAITTRQDLIAWLSEAEPGKEVTVQVRRGEETVDLKVTPKELER